MWTYNKVLEYPIKIKHKNPRLAKYIISQYGGPDGELKLLPNNFKKTTQVVIPYKLWNL